MKKIFILGLLIIPIMAHATDPVGPAAVGKGETPVIATANAPYATAREETGDTTNVVSASYVKGAYNDTIAAINKVKKNFDEYAQNVIDNKQNTLELDDDYGTQISSTVLLSIDDVEDEEFLVNGMAVKNAIDSVNSTISNKRVSAVTTWGNDTPTQLTLTTASN